MRSDSSLSPSVSLTPGGDAPGSSSDAAMVMGLGDARLLHLRLLGGFRVEHADVKRPVCGWQRRSAKTLTKLLATCPGHALHREPIIDILWPWADVDSALNIFG